MHQSVVLPDLDPTFRDDLSDQERRICEIRAIALYALLFEEKGFPAFRYFAELKELNSKRMRGAWLEARIATCVAGRIRPAIVMRTIKLLREHRESRNEIDRFDIFETFLKASLKGDRLTNHGYQQPQFGEIDHSPIWGRVSEHIGFLQQHGYQVFLNSGTLLGVVRDGRLIDHDDDVDLAVILRADSAEGAVAEWSALRAELKTQGQLDEERMDSNAILKLIGEGDIHFDLFPAWFEGDDFYVYPHSFGDLTRQDVLPLSPCQHSGHMIPADPAKMLANNYGQGWQAPDPYFKFPWNAARKKFKAFLAGVD
jgi:hypothetical protein